MILYGVSVLSAFAVSMILVIFRDYRTPEQRAAAKASQEPAVEVVEVSPAESNRAAQWVEVLGGKANITEAEAIAETRLRVIVADSSLVNRPALIETGVRASTEVSPGVWHLIVGLDADHYAMALNRKLASIDA